MRDCPRPDKQAYPPRGVALATLRRMSRPRRVALSPYLCACGQYHLGRRWRRPVAAWRS